MKTFMKIRFQPGGTLLLVSTGIVILLIFYMLLVYPQQQYVKKLDVKVATVQAQLELQEKLRPLYMRLAAQDKVGMTDRLVVPPKTSLSKFQINTIVPTISNIAKRSQMEIISMDPDLAVLQSNPESLLVNASLQGTFTNFRDFLVELGKIPYLETVGRIDIQQGDVIKKYKLEIWFSVK